MFNVQCSLSLSFGNAAPFLGDANLLFRFAIFQASSPVKDLVSPDRKKYGKISGNKEKSKF